jgi:hypothetical protein
VRARGLCKVRTLAGARETPTFHRPGRAKTKKRCRMGCQLHVNFVFRRSASSIFEVEICVNLTSSTRVCRAPPTLAVSVRASYPLPTAVLGKKVHMIVHVQLHVCTT